MQQTQQMSRAEFTALMSKLRANYQNAIADKSQWLASITVYWENLSSLPAEDLRQAFASAWRRFPDWMPSAGQLMSLALGKSPAARAAAAWPEVLELAKHSSPEHSDPVARRAIMLMGGGSVLGEMTQDELRVWGKKEFLQRYAEILKEDPYPRLELDYGKDGGQIPGTWREMENG